MPYLLYEKTKSNHKNIIGLFEQQSQAKMYVEMLKSKLNCSFRTKMCLTPTQYEKNIPRVISNNPNFVIEEVGFLDDNAELIEFILR